MKNLQFDFLIDKENKEIKITKECNADLNLVWDAWTKPELLDQWWAPKPYQNKTKSMDFREGGMWLYCMISPENEMHWCKNDYLKIEFKSSFTGLDAFCDEYGVINNNMPRTEWTNVFTQELDTTLVNISAKYNSLADLEMVIKMGFKEGFTMAISNLDELLNKLKNV